MPENEKHVFTEAKSFPRLGSDSVPSNPQINEADKILSLDFILNIFC